MRFPEGRAIRVGQWLPNEILRDADINNIGYAQLQNIIAALAAQYETLIEAGKDIVLGGLSLIHDNLLSADLKAGIAISPQGTYLTADTWGFSASAGDLFVVSVPEDTAVAFNSGGTDDRIDIVEVRPVELPYNAVSRNFKDPVTGLVSTAVVNTRREYGFEFAVREGVENVAPVAPTKTAGWIKLAEVYVASGASSITQADILDVRDCDEWTTEVAGTITRDTKEIVDPSTDTINLTNIGSRDVFISHSLTSAINTSGQLSVGHRLLIHSDSDIQVTVSSTTYYLVAGESAEWVSDSSAMVPIGRIQVSELSSGYANLVETSATLPSDPALGDRIEVVALADGATILQPDAESLIIASRTATSTKGTGGSLELKDGDCVHLTYIGDAYEHSLFDSIVSDPATVPLGNGRATAWSPDGRYLAVNHEASPYVIFYDWSSGSPVKIADPATLPPTNATGAGAWSPDGRYYALGTNASPYVVIYDWNSGSPVKVSDPATLPNGPVFGASWSRDSRYLACGGPGSPYLNVYDWTTGSPVKEANPGTLPATTAIDAEFSNSSDFLFVGASSTMYVYSYRTGSFTYHAVSATFPASIRSISMSPDGKYLAVALTGGPPYAVVFDLTVTGDLDDTFKVNFTEEIAFFSIGAGWSPDGRYLCFANNNPTTATPRAYIYDMWTRPAQLILPGTDIPDVRSWSADVSPDGRYVAFAYDQTPYFRVYDNRVAAATKAWKVHGLGKRGRVEGLK